MSFADYQRKMACMCPVAIKLHQTEVHAPEHADGASWKDSRLGRTELQGVG